MLGPCSLMPLVFLCSRPDKLVPPNCLGDYWSEKFGRYWIYFKYSNLTYKVHQKSLGTSTDGINWSVGVLKTRGVAKIKPPTP